MFQFSISVFILQMKQQHFNVALFFLTIEIYLISCYNINDYFKEETNQKILSDRNRYMKFNLFQIRHEKGIGTRSPFKVTSIQRRKVFQQSLWRQQNDQYVWDDYGKFWTYRNRYDSTGYDPDYYYNDQQFVRNSQCRPPFCYPRRCNQIQCGQSNCVMSQKICPRSGMDCGNGQKPVIFGSEVLCVNQISDENCSPSCGENGVCIKKKCYCETGYSGETCLILNPELCKQKKSIDCAHGCSFDKRINEFNCVCGNREPQLNCIEVRTCEQGCQNGGVCMYGKCQCSEGFEGDKCQNEIGSCSPGQMGNKTCEQICVSDGKQKFQCKCRYGYYLTDDGRSCRKYQCSEIGSLQTIGEICKCKSGWTGTLCSEDVDECSSQNRCQQVCLNVPGSYKCQCHEGFTLSLNSKCIKNCLNNCSGNGDCFNGICYCFPGWHKEDCASDIDECRYNHGCEHKCVNTRGSFKCECFNGSALQQDQKSCSPLPCSTECLNGGFCKNNQCICTPGYMGSNCEIFDFCKLLSPCQHICKMVSNHFECSCRPGYHLAGDSQTCIESCQCVHGTCLQGICKCNKGYTGVKCDEDINECSRRTHECEQICINTPGSYSCLCFGEFQLMADNKSCKQLACSCINGECSNSKCICRTGFMGELCDQDIDECQSKSTCSQICINLHGSYKCACNPGFLLAADRKTCTQECKDCGKGYCKDGQCICPTGYQGEFCQYDINECLSDQHHCEQSCINEYGGYKCFCHQGFVLAPDNRTCILENCKIQCKYGNCLNGKCICSSGYQGKFCDEDLDECLSDNPCEHKCINTIGSYKCECNENYKLSTDLRSCKLNLCKMCKNGRCQVDGSCVCNKGFKGKHCDEDIDECKSWRGLCQHICSNIHGSYKCLCRPGFVLSADQHSCVSVCSMCKNGKCDFNGKCQCKSGWTGDICDIDVDECLSGIHKCQQNCINTKGSYSCSCNEQFQLSTLDGRSCLEKNENCSVVCVNGGKCVNNKCQCKPGYRGNSCEEDINECLLPTSYHGCMGECRNTFGNYECICPPGYVVLDDQKTCAVSAKDTMCNPHCLNGGVCRDMRKCFCPSGFQGKDCGEDVNECERYAPCDKDHGICQNTYGSYYCKCNIKYVLMYDGTSCMTITEAVLKPHLRYRGRGTKGVTRIIEN